MQTVVIELVEDFDKTYYANVNIDGKSYLELPEYVSYNVLKKAIKEKIGIHIQRKPEFEKYGKKSYAHLEFII